MNTIYEQKISFETIRNFPEGICTHDKKEPKKKCHKCRENPKLFCTVQSSTLSVLLPMAILLQIRVFLCFPVYHSIYFEAPVMRRIAPYKYVSTLSNNRLCIFPKSTANCVRKTISNMFNSLENACNLC